MMNKNADREISVAIRLLRTSVLAAVVLGLSSCAEDQRKAAEAHASVSKAGEARTAPPPARSKVATQKLMRNPWEKKTVVVRDP